MKTRGMGRIFQPTYKGSDGSRRPVSVWWVAYWHRGKEHRERAGTKAQAIDRLKARYAEIKSQTWVGREIERVTLKELIDGLRAEYRLSGRRSLKRAAEPAFKALLDYFGADRRASTIEPTHLQAYVLARQAQGRAAATCRNELSLMRRAYRLAHKRKQGPPPPADFPMPLVDNARVGFLDPPDFAALVVALPDDDLRDVVRFAWQSGWRRGEILTLRWADVDRDGRVIYLRREASKNKTPRTLALEGALWTLIEARWAARRVTAADGTESLAELVFHRRTKPIKDFRGAWAKACETAGVGGRLFHDLRRSAIRNMVRAGVRESVAMRISGHKTRSVFDRYNITDERDLREAVTRTESYLQARAQEPSSRRVVSMTAR